MIIFEHKCWHISQAVEGKVGQPDEIIIVVPGRALKYCAAQGYSLVLASSQSSFTAALQPHSGRSLEVMLSAQASVPPATAILGHDKELKQCGALRRFGSCTQHMFSCINCFFNTPTPSVIFRQQERKATKRAREP